MKKYSERMFTIVVFVLAIALSGVAYAGGEAKDMVSSDLKVHDADAKQAAIQSAGITLSGTINESNQLIDNQGKAFELSENTEEGLEVKALIGQKVELKGTVLDENGQKTMEVLEYKILDN